MGIHLAAFAATETVKNAEIEGKKMEKLLQKPFEAPDRKKMVSIDPK